MRTLAVGERMDPGGLVFDQRRRILIMADDQAGMLHAIDARGRRPFAEIPAAPGAAGHNALGTPALGDDGSVYVARLGHGAHGALFRITPDGRVTQLALDNRAAWRTAIAVDDAAGRLYSAAFTHFEGWVAAHALDGEVERVFPGFQRPVGLARLGHTLLVADQRAGAVFSLDLRWTVPVRVRLFDELPNPSSLTCAGDDSALVTTFDRATGVGAVYRLWIDGRRQLVARGTWEARGVAYDGRTRVFVATRRACRVGVMPAIMMPREVRTLESVLRSLEEPKRSAPARALSRLPTNVRPRDLAGQAAAARAARRPAPPAPPPPPPRPRPPPRPVA